MSVKTEQVAWDFYYSGEAFTSQTLIDKYGIDIVRASQIIIQLDKAAKYDCEIERNGRFITSIKVLSVKGKDTIYLKVRELLESTGEALSTPDLVERFGLIYGTAGHILFKLRKDPKIHTEVVQKGRAIAVRVKKAPVVALAPEAKIWWELATKRWSDMRLEVAA